MTGTPTRTTNDARSRTTRLLSYIVATLGIALIGSGASVHLSVAALTKCDGCSPWHPLFVLAPLLLGSLLVVVAGVVRART